MSYLYPLFLSLYVINNLGLYTNSCYWRKTLIKLSNLTNSVYNFNNNGSETEKVAPKLLTKQARYVGRWSRGQASHLKQGTQGMLEREHLSSQGTLTGEYVSTQGIMTGEAYKHSRHVGKWARKHAGHVSM